MGTVANIEKAFNLTLLVYPHPTENRNFYAPSVDPSVALAVPLLQISGLDNYSLPHPNSRIGPATPPIPSGRASPSAARKVVNTSAMIFGPPTCPGQRFTVTVNPSPWWSMTVITPSISRIIYTWPVCRR